MKELIQAHGIEIWFYYISNKGSYNPNGVDFLAELEWDYLELYP